MQDPDLNYSEEERIEEPDEKNGSPGEVGSGSNETEQENSISSDEESREDLLPPDGENPENVNQQNEQHSEGGIKLNESLDPTDLPAFLAKDEQSELSQESIDDTSDTTDIYSTSSARGWYNPDGKVSQDPDSMRQESKREEVPGMEDTQPIIISHSRTPTAEQSKIDSRYCKEPDVRLSKRYAADQKTIDGKCADITR